MTIKYKKLLASLLILSFTMLSSSQVYAISNKKALEFSISTIDFSGISESIKDLSRNYCTRSKIINLRDNEKLLRDQIIDALNKDENADISSMLNTYQQYEAEIFFLRHFTGNSENKYTNENEKNLDKTPKQKLEDNMSNYFLSKKTHPSTSKISEYISSFYKKYDNDAFLNCENTSYSGISSKLQKIKDSFAKLFLNEEKQDDKTTEETPKNEITVKDKPASFISDWLEGRIKVKENGVKPTTTIEDVFKTQTPEKDTNTSQNPVVQKQTQAVINEVEKDKSRYAQEKRHARQEALHEFKYQQISDSIDSEMILSLNELNNIIDNTIPILDNVGKCLDDAEKRECGE